MVQLVFQTAFIGDLLLSSALLKQIRHSHPQDKIVLVCRKGCGDLMLSLGFADEVFEIDKRRPGAWRALREQFRARGWLGAGGGRMLSGGGAAAGGAFGGEGPRDVGDDAVSTNTAMSGDEGRVYANEESGIASISRTNTREGESMTNTGRANAFE